MTIRSAIGRREFLCSALGMAASVPALACGEGPRPRVAIVGAGMAGIATAWLLDDDAEIVLFEAGPRIGGNVRSIAVDVGGTSITVDVGAQYFNPGPYPLYLGLLAQLGLEDRIYTTPSTITILGRGESVPRFVSPLLGTRDWPLQEDWNADGVSAFAVLSTEARRHDQDGDWNLTMDQWLAGLSLTEAQKDRIVLPWTASLYTGSIDQARVLSARSAMTFLARGFDASTKEVRYSVLTSGMIEVLERMLDASPHAIVHPSTAVAGLGIEPDGRVRVITADGGTAVFDEVVLAVPAWVAAGLLAELPGQARRRAALSEIEHTEARVMIHRDPVFADPDPEYHSFLNCLADGSSCEASMSLATVLPPLPDGHPLDLWKSWVTHRTILPEQVVHDASYRHVLPTPTTLAAQARIAGDQGLDRIWLASGTLRAFDAQETALAAALEVATAIAGEPARARGLV